MNANQSTPDADNTGLQAAEGDNTHEVKDAQAENTEQVPAADKPKPVFTLKHFAEKLGHIRSIATSFVLLILVFVLIGSAAKAMWQDIVMIEPIRVPQDLVRRGYTAEVVAHRLIDQALKIHTEVMSQREGHVLAADWLQADIQVPGAGISIKSLLGYVQALFGFSEKRIGGEITHDGDLFQLRIRLTQKGVNSQSLSVYAKEVNTLVRRGAEKLIESTDPYLMAYYLVNKDPERAKNLLQMCLIKPPVEDDVWAYNLWGLIHLQEGKTDSAKEKFQQAILLDPEFPLAYSNWGLALAGRGKHDEADAKFEQAVKIDPNAGMIYNGWGLVHAMRGDEEGANAHFQKAIELDPDNPRIYFGWGVAFDRSGKKDQAFEKINKALSLNPEFIEAHIYIAEKMYWSGSYPEAVKHYQKVSSLSPYYAKKLTYYTRSLTRWGDKLAGDGDIRAAIEKYDQAIAFRQAPWLHKKKEELQAKLVTVSTVE